MKITSETRGCASAAIIAAVLGIALGMLATHLAK